MEIHQISTFPDAYFYHNVGGARQITIPGRITNLNGEKYVHLGLKCVNNSDVHPLSMIIYENRMEISNQPSKESPLSFSSTFKNGPITITITIFADQFYVTLLDPTGFTTHDFEPFGLFEEDLAVESCTEREIFYTTETFQPDTVTVEPRFIYAHTSPFFPGHTIEINGNVIKEGANFYVEIGSTVPRVRSPLTLKITDGEVILKCYKTEKMKKAEVLAGPVRITISISDTRYDVQVEYGEGDEEDWFEMSCMHRSFLSNISHIFVGPMSSMTVQRPVIEQENAPVYITRYTDDSAYKEYTKFNSHLEYIKNVLSGGAFKYGLWVDADRKSWNIIPDHPGSFGLQFSRLPYHFSQCPCDCMSDAENVILMDQFYKANYTETTHVKTIVFYQWVKGVAVRLETEKHFLLEIFSVPKRIRDCDWDDSKMIITSIEEEFDAIEPTKADPVEKVFVNSANVTDHGILIWSTKHKFHIEAYGRNLTLSKPIVFVQIVGLKSLRYVPLK